MFQILAPTGLSNRLFLISSKCKITPIVSSLIRKNINPKGRSIIINKALCIASISRPQFQIIIKSSFVIFKPSINKIFLVNQGSTNSNATIRPTVGQLFPRGVKYN